jgi:hypothetical protein
MNLKTRRRRKPQILTAIKRLIEGAGLGKPSSVVTFAAGVGPVIGTERFVDSLTDQEELRTQTSLDPKCLLPATEDGPLSTNSRKDRESD